MFFKLFLKVLKKLSPEKKDIVRGVLDGKTETVIENNKTAKPMKAQAKKGKKEKRRTKKMADEIKKDEAAKVEEEKETKTTETVEETEKTTPDKKEETKDEVKDETKDKVENSDENGENESQPQEGVVQEESGDQSGMAAIAVEDLVTKEMLEERFNALSAKFDAVIKENNDLKSKLDELEGQDFGNIQKRGVQVKDADANETFESYSARFK